MRRVRPNSTLTWILCAAWLPLGCGTVGKVNALLDEARNTARKAGDVADAVPNMVTKAQTEATDAVTQSVANLGGIPAMAPQFTGGQDVGRSSSGRAGTFDEDIDGDGAPDTVSVFVDDQDDAFLSFELPWEEGRDCYTSWDAEDGVWLVITECGDVAVDELVDVCRWELDSDEVFCVGLLCTGDDCEVELCYDDTQELDCGFENDPAVDDGVLDDGTGDDGTGDDGTGDDGTGDGTGDCSADVANIVDAYVVCGFGEPAPDCDAEPDLIEQCAAQLASAGDVCAFLDSDEGYEACPW